MNQPIDRVHIYCKKCDETMVIPYVNSGVYDFSELCYCHHSNHIIVKAEPKKESEKK